MMSGLPCALGEKRGPNFELYVKKLIRDVSFLVRGDQTSHVTLWLRPSDVHVNVLGSCS